MSKDRVVEAYDDPVALERILKEGVDEETLNFVDSVRIPPHACHCEPARSLRKGWSVVDDLSMLRHMHRMAAQH